MHQQYFLKPIKMFKIITLLFLSFSALSISQEIGAITDSRDGKVYKIVVIGTQTWMTRNLDASNFRNGDPIPEARTNEEWEKAGKEGKPAWCYYENDLANGAKYGKLYNWYAVKDSRGLAPEGYHVPSDAEWTQIKDYLGGESDAGGKMKNTTGWVSPNKDASNSSGFLGLPGGNRTNWGKFNEIEERGTWWSSTENSQTSEYAVSDPFAYWFGLHSLVGGTLKNIGNESCGYSIRCVKD